MRVIMRLFILFLAVGLAFYGVLAGGKQNAGKAESAVEKEILRIDGEKDRAMQSYVASHGKSGGADLERIYADDLVFVNTKGQLLTKAQRLQDLRAGHLEFLSFGRDSYKLHVYGETVIMTGRATSVVKYNGRLNRIPRQFTNVYIKLNGQWRLVAHQATTIAQK